jgi:hypothetical protein
MFIVEAQLILFKDNASRTQYKINNGIFYVLNHLVHCISRDASALIYIDSAFYLIRVFL